MRSRQPGARWSVRPATSADAEAMGRVHVRAWQAAYRGVMTDVFLDSLDPSARAEYWRAALSDPSLPGDRLVLLAGEEVAGLAACGPALDGPSDTSPDTALGQLYAINLDPDWWGTGGGTVLLDACTTALRAAGFAEAILWVATLNDRARRFYAARGWEPDGACASDDFGGGVVEEVRYRRVLTD